MQSPIENFINYLKLSPVYELLLPIFQRKELAAWQKRGKTHPTPELVKQALVKKYAEKYSLSTLIETGTYLGSMVNASKNRFKKIYSIEIDPTLHKRAQKKFAKKEHINILKGDSILVLPKILNSVKEPALFWLDAHYSEGITGKGETETPILAEINSVLSHEIKNHVILIDDANSFNGTHDYPTLDLVRKNVLKKNPRLKVYVKNGIIFIHSEKEVLRD